MTDITRAESPLDMSLSEDELEELRSHIGSFIREQYEAAGASVAVIGLSGGIDSTLTSHLAVEALGRESVYALVQPSEVNRERNMSDAEGVASELLGVEYDTVGIEPLAQAMLEASPEAAWSHDETVGNLRARLRAVQAYIVANHRDGIVLGTGNRTEAAVGYFTKYGDGAVDCHPIGTLYKQQVRQLAAHVGVPEDIVNKTASAELWAGQTDEEELGIGYETLDSILALHVDGPLSIAGTARTIGVDEATVEQVRSLHKRSRHKRQAPPAPDSLY